MIGAIIDAWAAVTGAVHAFANLPWPVVLVSIVVGMILGAWLGRVAVTAILTMGVALYFTARRQSHPDPPMARDAHKPRNPAGKRTFNPDTNSWE